MRLILFIFCMAQMFASGAQAELSDFYIQKGQNAPKETLTRLQAEFFVGNWSCIVNPYFSDQVSEVLELACVSEKGITRAYARRSKTGFNAHSQTVELDANGSTVIVELGAFR